MAKRPFPNTDAGKPRNEGSAVKRPRTDDITSSIKQKVRATASVPETIHSVRQLQTLFADYANDERIQYGAANS